MTPAVLVGLGIGDALGMPFETLKENVHPLLATWDGSFQPGTWHQLPPGRWTDDTEMAAALAEALLVDEGYNPNTVAAHYLAWSKDAPTGMGGTTREAMSRLASGLSWRTSGVVFTEAANVGAAPPMRAAPLGLRFRNPRIACVVDANITHVHREAEVASYLVALAVSAAIEQIDVTFEMLLEAAPLVAPSRPTSSPYRPTLVEQAVNEAMNHADNEQPFAEALSFLGRRGNCAQIVSTTLYCALTAPDFATGVQAAVRGGGDADTRGAIAGAILGARFGLEGIPEAYKAGLHRFEYLADLDAKLFAKRQRPYAPSR